MAKSTKKIKKESEMSGRLRQHLVTRPELFSSVFFGLDLWEKQATIVQSVFANKRTAVPAGHSVGKSFCLALVTLTFLFLMPDAIVVTTAPTYRQVKELLWREIHRACANAKKRGYDLGGRLLTLKYELSPHRFAIGFATDKASEGVQFQGWHSKNLLLVYDEAAGIEREIWEAGEGALASYGARILVAGNPFSRATEFYDACVSPNWNVIPISSWETPNAVSGEDVIPGLATREWCEDMRREYGEHSNIYKFRVLGEFPDDTTDTLIALSWCLKAQQQPELSEADESTRVGGVDVARYGDDRTVIWSMIGGHTNEVVKLSHRSTTTVTGAVVNIAKKHNWQIVAVDDSGVGGGVTDQLIQQGIATKPVNFGGVAYDQEHFYNKAAEMMAWLADDLRQGRLTGLPTRDDTVKQLTSRKYEFTPRGQIKLEPKDKYKERVGNSPDEGDAYMLANYARRLVSGGAGVMSGIFV